MIATTQGLGPFYPKIIFADKVYISDLKFDNEDVAGAYAQNILDKAERLAIDVITTQFRQKPEIG